MKYLHYKKAIDRDVLGCIIPFGNSGIFRKQILERI